MVSFDELQARTERRRRLLRLTLWCVALVVLTWLATTPFPPSLL